MTDSQDYAKPTDKLISEKVRQLEDRRKNPESRDFYALVLKASLLVQALEESEKLAKDTLYWRSRLLEDTNLTEQEYNKARINFDDRRTSFKLARENAIGARNRLKEELNKLLD
jgi:hypothetical protein